MNKIAIAVHGGAGPDSDFIHKNKVGYKKGIEDAINAGYQVLENGGTSIDAVEAAVKRLEDNPLFNAGKGAALNSKAEVEMCASIMRGEDLNSGAVAIVKNVKNPVSLARAVMEKTRHIYLGNQGALDFAKEIDLPLETDAYFITDHQYEVYAEATKKDSGAPQKVAPEQINESMHGTVGAVALDQYGNIAAATSTGGTENAKEGRIGDSSMIGIGSYANNDTCAVSSTGDGEVLIKHVSGFHISALMEYKGFSLNEAAWYFIHEKCKDVSGDMGIIAVDNKGNIAIEFNSERMHRGSKTSDSSLKVAIYR
ncbi:MAG: isoaspartyl peptidase/L-asparaginase family protein [Candidatus Dadabacteria bacterium]